MNELSDQSPPPTTEREVRRTLAHEYVGGLKVAAYVNDVETLMGTVNSYCSHWSTPGKSAKNLRRLFDEETVFAAIDRLTADRDRWRNDCLDANQSDLVLRKRADLAAEQVREAYKRGLDDAARVADVKPRKGGRPLSGDHHSGIRYGRAEAARLIRALKSDDTNEAAASPTKEPSPGRVVSSVAPAAWQDVIAERERQINEEGWTPGHDDWHVDGELARAAHCYAWLAAQGDTMRGMFDNPPPTWPEEWDDEWWKPTTRRRDLIKAGALILAEIERLDRADPPQETTNDR